MLHRDQLDTLACSNLPLCAHTEVPWGSYKAKCFLHSWAEITPSVLQKPAASLDNTSILPALPSSTDGNEICSMNSLESAREDGELPSAGLSSIPASRVPKFTDLTEKRLYSFKEKSHMKRFLSTPAKGALFTMMGNSGSTGFDGLEAGTLNDDDILLESTALEDDQMDYMDKSEICLCVNFQESTGCLGEMWQLDM